ncbi:ninjurin-1 [Caerostris extrusa]|uniref:Ninjurin-1 n=1 Tax=Caerostris extrusa TaxID=172846 RepID=A0AAV4UHJ7_CAEEX|nr:ninjurin-1 [Caerostris extrusa]
MFHPSFPKRDWRIFSEPWRDSRQKTWTWKNLCRFTNARLPHAKAYAQMSMDIALVVTNIAHLTRVLRGNPHDEMRTAKITLISVSIALEVIIGILLFVKERYDIDDEKCHKIMNLLNDTVVLLIFTSVLVHVFVSVFVDEHHIPPHALSRYSHGNCSA